MAGMYLSYTKPISHSEYIIDFSGMYYGWDWLIEWVSEWVSEWVKFSSSSRKTQSHPTAILIASNDTVPRLINRQNIALTWPSNQHFFLWFQCSSCCYWPPIHHCQCSYFDPFRSYCKDTIKDIHWIWCLNIQYIHPKMSAWLSCCDACGMQ